MLFFIENIEPDNIIQNLLNLRNNYTRRFLHMSPWSISNYTIHLFGKLIKRKFQEEVTTKLRVTKISKLYFVRLKLRNRRHIPKSFLWVSGRRGFVQREILSTQPLKPLNRLTPWHPEISLAPSRRENFPTFWEGLQLLWVCQTS